MGLNKSTLSEQIYQILRNDILTQKIKCGEKLTLKVLQERFQVSSTPVREALTRLTQDQLVSYYSNIGVNVISFSPEDRKPSPTLEKSIKTESFFQVIFDGTGLDTKSSRYSSRPYS